MPDKRLSPAPLLSLEGVSKSFAGVSALENVSLCLRRGEVLALLGDNGAGKSTLVKILSGVHRPDAGQMRIRGIPVDFRRYNVQAARRLGVETVHQERALGEQQALWRNVFVGRHLTDRFGFIQVRREKDLALELLRQRLGLRGAGLGADSPVSILSGGERQGLAIARAMHFQADILVLDEPTTALSLKETRKVLDFMGQIREEMKSCILVSHNIRHAYMAADRFAILDHGILAGEYSREELDEEELMRRVIDAAAGRTRP